ncbi:hypothetical protein MGYG_05782 [Nannizzia gypsea CBS 118893]|uniref:Uncharacterized protein n=1 Tax=Arthroderma gypseum (strain ATCC MYA-4604 / CBS 118893) TaxID=535722 RepID=E4UXV1_ARTGP|nr:hypothetical protein MGYG_05782 [Nannizzia gypsea CBS 118893]EFR02783.1 hypothetical protein MGYG_05782 [Nannizzia gypsea CBS 118893]
MTETPHNGLSKDYALYHVLKTSMNYITMEYVEGKTLDTEWKSLSDREKEGIVSTLKQYFIELRKLLSPGYFGSLGRRRMPGGMIWTPEPTPEINGPHSSTSPNRSIDQHSGQSFTIAPYQVCFGAMNRNSHIGTFNGKRDH